MKYRGINISWGKDGSEKPPMHPVNSVKAMRGCFVALEHDMLPEYASQVFESYWSHCDDISKDSVLREILEKIGMFQVFFVEKVGVVLSLYAAVTLVMCHIFALFDVHFFVSCGHMK